MKKKDLVHNSILQLMMYRNL